MKKFMSLLGIMLSTSLVLAGDATVAKEFRIERSTLHCLGFEWDIGGDDNRNAAVEVLYRKSGTKTWEKVLPLLRIGNEKVGGVAGWPLTITPHMFAGSIFNLEPETEYEVRFVLNDPDGGGVEKIVSAKTKSLPKMFADGSVLHVYPSDFKGKKADLAFDSLQAAYDKAQAGDRILVHAGTYPGSYVWNKSGTLEKPIVIMGAGDGETILVNTSSNAMFNIHKADYLWFENLTFRAPGTAQGCLNGVDGVILLAGNDSIGAAPGCKGLVVRYCKFEDIGIGIKGEDCHCRDFTITDNIFRGRQNWDRPYGHDWELPERQGKPDKYRTSSWVAVYLSGQGHDIGHNYVRDFWDGLAVAGHAKTPVFAIGKDLINASIDIYNNDIANVDDDFIETDQGVHNIRVMRNRCANSRSSGLSAQPIYGGPAYFIRNAVYKYHSAGALKFNVCPAGLLVYHNTLIGGYFKPTPVGNVHFRNNILIGPFSACTQTPYSSFDYDAISSATFAWNGANFPKGRVFTNLAEFARETGQEMHGISAGTELFENVVEPYTEVKGFEPLGKDKRLKAECRPYDPDAMDMRLQKGCAAVDAGCVLPNVNDDFTGKAPDLGAYEHGVEPPVYGPRKQSGA